MTPSERARYEAIRRTKTQQKAPVSLRERLLTVNRGFAAALDQRRQDERVAAREAAVCHERLKP